MGYCNNREGEECKPFTSYLLTMSSRYNIYASVKLLAPFIYDEHALGNIPRIVEKDASNLIITQVRKCFNVSNWMA